MNSLGIIAEYNPFHNGHKWQIEEAKRLSNCSYTIAVMSGHFTQRGEPAFFDKWSRAEMAVKGGIDVVFELPTVFSTRSAQYFAQGGIQLLKLLQTTFISFGAETSDIQALQAIADRIDHPQTINRMLAHLKTGCTYAKALGLALGDVSSCSAFSFTPNNILALEYLRALKRYDCSMTPIIVPRYMADYHDSEITSSIASARAIRNTITMNNFNKEAQLALPETTTTIIKNLLESGRGPVTLSAFSDMILAALRTTSLADLANLPDMSEGLYNKLHSTALQVTNTPELINKLKSKRYTHTHLQRLLIHILLRNKADLMIPLCNAGPLYARVLAFNDKGREILKRLQQRSSIPIITKTTSILDSNERHRHTLTPLQQMLAIDTQASDLYCLGIPNQQSHYGGLDFTQSPIYSR